MTMNDNDLKKMQFIFNLGKRMDDIGMTVEDLVTVLSGNIITEVSIPRPERYISWKRPDFTPDLQVEDGKGLVAVDRVSPTEDQDKMIRQNVHRYLMRTKFSKDLDTTDIGRIESLFYEGLDSKGHLIPVKDMQDLFEKDLGKHIGCMLLYGLRSAYRNAVRDVMNIDVPDTTSKRPVMYRKTGKPSMKKLDRTGKIRRFILDEVNSKRSGKKIIMRVKKKFGIDLNQKQIYNVKYKDKIHKDMNLSRSGVKPKVEAKTEDIGEIETVKEKERNIITMPKELSDDRKLRIRKFIIARHKDKTLAKDIVTKVKEVFGVDINLQKVYDTAYEDRQRRKKKTGDRFNAKDKGDMDDKDEDKKKRSKNSTKIGVFMGKVNKIVSKKEETG